MYNIVDNNTHTYIYIYIYIIVHVRIVGTDIKAILTTPLTMFILHNVRNNS